MVNSGFENKNLTPWIIIGNGATLSNTTVHSGNQSVEISAGTIVRMPITLKPSSVYELTGWLKTESGSGEVKIDITGVGDHNTGVSSALADWKKVKLKFTTGADQTKANVDIQNPENISNLKAWADDINIKYLGKYVPQSIKGIHPLSPRIPVSDLGIRQQNNSKMAWLLDAKFGMMIHWGLYSGPAQGEWYMENKGILPKEYDKLAYPESGKFYFAADKFNADHWASLAKVAGMKFMVMVTMHHEGYALFKTAFPGAFTSEQTHHRDFVKAYVKACRKYGLKVGLYKTLINWQYPGYYDVTGTDCKPNTFGYTTNIAHKENARLMKNELYCQTKELMTHYGKIDLLFWDGGWIAQQGTDAQGDYFWEPGKYLNPNNPWPVDRKYQVLDKTTGIPLGLMGIVRKYQPDVVANSRSGWIGDYAVEEGSAPVTGPVRSEEVWVKAMSMSPAWGYTPYANDTAHVISYGKLKRMIADCVVRNMILLLNVGPDRHGQIPGLEQDVLRKTGQWLKYVGVAVYGTRGGPWNPKDGEYGFTYKGNTIYIYLLDGFKDKEFIVPPLNKGQKVIRAYSVTDGKPVTFQQKDNQGIVLKDFHREDKEVTILAIELNKPVLP
nr:alpha-L-fucosidase [Microbacter margulisiae]